jgi:hypothetical protein
MPERRHDLLQRLAAADSFAPRLGNFAGSPEDQMDAFSEILSGVKLKGAVFFSAELSAPWGLTTPPTKVMAATHAPAAEHLVLYHLVIEGGAFIELTDGESIELGPGDIVIFPHGDPHHMSSGAGAVRPFPNYGIGAKIASRDLSPYKPAAAVKFHGSSVGT